MLRRHERSTTAWYGGGRRRARPPRLRAHDLPRKQREIVLRRLEVVAAVGERNDPPPAW